MRKANTAYRALLLLTLFFVLVAAASFAAFRETKTLCTSASESCRPTPKSAGGQMLWDDFSRRFISLVAEQ